MTKQNSHSPHPLITGQPNTETSFSQWYSANGLTDHVKANMSDFELGKVLDLARRAYLFGKMSERKRISQNTQMPRETGATE